MKVVIIGSGNVATVLGKKMKATGTQVLQVISRTSNNGMKLADALNAAYCDNILSMRPDFDLCLIAVPDQHISTVVKEMPHTNALLVHTAGSVSQSVLKEAAINYGVLYPLQTLNKKVETLPAIPVIIDGNSEETKEKLKEFASHWSPMITYAGDEKRLQIHVAAVIANNFTNHLMALVEEFCQKEAVDFKLFFPLIEETINKLGTLPPTVLQTGPAVRGDIATIDKHLQLLNHQPVLRSLYLKFTESIIVKKNLSAIDLLSD